MGKDRCNVPEMGVSRMGLHGARTARHQEPTDSALKPITGSANGKKFSQHSALQLICLDYLQWLRNGRDVAEKLHCSQSCVSRQSRSCLDLFALQARKQQGELKIEGDSFLLNESRRLHQLFRISGLEAIRIEAPGSIIPATGPLSSRIPICFACTTPRNPIALTQLLLERVIDMWISHTPPERNTLDTLPATDHQLITISITGTRGGDGYHNHLTCLPEVSGTAAFEAILTAINQA